MTAAVATVTREAAVEATLAQAARYEGRVVLLLDGGSGSGKTVLAGEIAQTWCRSRREALQVVHLDDVYPGWHGLASASRAVTESILRTDQPGHATWHWTTHEPGPWVSLDPARPLLVEGCGALTRASAPMAQVRVWLELAEPVRRTRALARDEGYEPWWDVWAAQETEHWRRNRPWELATVRVQG